MAAEVSSGSTFLTGTSDEEDKAKRLAALRSAADPEEAMKSPGEALLGSMMGDALAQVVQDAAQQEAARKKASGIEEGSEEHWNLVMKKIAPTGYKKSPQWQKGIVDRVIKKMAGRAKTGEGNPLTQGPSTERMTVDLSAIGLSNEAAQGFVADETRWRSQTMSTLGASTKKSGGVTIDSLTRTGKGPKVPPTTVERGVSENQNKVAHYVRAIQGEQLVEQDLDADLAQMSAEVERSVAASQGGFARTLQQTAKVERQIAIIKNRCQQLNIKASQVASENAEVRLGIDDLRTEKQMHLFACEKMRQKAGKMEEDISFLTQAAHAALDQREKVKGKFMSAQRDAQQEREQKLSIIRELMERAAMLDEDWGLREADLDDEEETRKRRLYVTGRLRRGELEAKETRYGFLANQVKGWDGEFQRLQAFTGMDSSYKPGDDHIVNEVTNRFLEKERANTSLLRYLHEQQAEMIELEEEQRRQVQKRAELTELLEAAASEGGAPDSGEALQAVLKGDEERTVRTEATLESTGRIVQRMVGFLWFEGTQPDLGISGRTECNVSNLEAFMRSVEARISEMYHASRRLCDQRQDVEPPSVLREWTAARPKKQLHSTGEIHDALLLQAAQQNSRKGGLDDDDDEEEAERAREKESKLSPFHRVKVDRAKERQQIVDWARKRQGQIAAQRGADDPATQAAMTKAISAEATRTLGRPAMQGSAAVALRGSASAPSLPSAPPPPPPPPPPGPGAATSDGKSACASAYTAQHGAAPPQRGTADYGRAVLAAAESGARDVDRMEQRLAAAEAAAEASVAGLSQTSVDAGAYDDARASGRGRAGGGRGGPSPAGRGRGRGGGGKAAKKPPGSGSMPWLGQSSSAASVGGGGGGGGNTSSGGNSLGQTPKDLGTMIYLLGTQSSSINARRLGSR